MKEKQQTKTGNESITIERHNRIMLLSNDEHYIEIDKKNKEKQRLLNEIQRKNTEIVALRLEIDSWKGLIKTALKKLGIKRTGIILKLTNGRELIRRILLK